MSSDTTATASFNTQPPKGGWLTFSDDVQEVKVSTHSRLKAAGNPVK